MTLYDIFKKSLENNLDISQYTMGFFTFLIAFMIFHIVMQPTPINISEDARIIIMLFSAIYILQNVLDFVNFIVIVLTGSYIGIVDILRWIKHKWAEL